MQSYSVEFQNCCFHFKAFSVVPSKCRIMINFLLPCIIFWHLFAGVDMLMKAAGKDCTALFSILLLLFFFALLLKISCCLLWTHTATQFFSCKLMCYRKAWNRNDTLCFVTWSLWRFCSLISSISWWLTCWWFWSLVVSLLWLCRGL